MRTSSSGVVHKADRGESSHWTRIGSSGRVHQANMGGGEWKASGPWSEIITQHTCARGKAIGLSVDIVMRIARSQVLGISACCNYHKLVDVSKKTGFCALRIAEHGSLVLQIVHFRSACLWFTGRTHSMC